MLASLRYNDTFVKRDGVWLFAERLLYVDWVDERALSHEAAGDRGCVRSRRERAPQARGTGLQTRATRLAVLGPPQRSTNESMASFIFATTIPLLFATYVPPLTLGGPTAPTLWRPGAADQFSRRQ